MKATATKAKPARASARSDKILQALRDARKMAVKSARIHGVPVVYLKGGKLVRERPGVKRKTSYL